MILRRVGNKAKIANDIIKYFPEHNVYIELFFGAGGLYFNKPEAKYNYLNDIDEDIYNLYQALKMNPDELEKECKLIPYHEKIFKEFKKQTPLNPVMRAVRFLNLSNYCYLGNSDVLRLTSDNNKRQLLQNIEKTLSKIKYCQFLCCDFRDVLKKISYRKNDKVFIYADPPYIETSNNYSDSFTKKDTEDLFILLNECGHKFAISEFKNKFIIELANQYKLNIIEIIERQTLKNRNTEILITNYKNNDTLFCS